MTKLKLCGMMKDEDILTVNDILPDYIGFIFWEKSFRNLSREKAANFKSMLDERIKAVGVFVDADKDFVTGLVKDGIIDIVQLHGSEDEAYISSIRTICPDTEIIKAFKVTNEDEVLKALESTADYLLFDPGKGSGETFNWNLIKDVKRPYFLAGGLNCDNVYQAVKELSPYAVDVSSGIEENKQKSKDKMYLFTNLVREGEKK